MILLNLKPRKQKQISHHKKEDISEELNRIRDAVSNGELFSLFRQLASDLLRVDPNDKIIANVATAVDNTRRTIDDLPPINIKECLNLDQHAKASIILADGCKGLNDLMSSNRRKSPSQLQTEISKAICLDKVRFDKEIEWATRNTPTKAPAICVYSMDDPTRRPLFIPSRYTKYKQLRWYLIDRKVVDQADIWIRYEDIKNNRFTPNGRYWEFAKPTQSIEADNDLLEVDVVEVTKRSEYIVAVLCDENNQEIPIPLDIGKGGGPCCNPNCGNLRAHLNKLWPSRVIVRAHLLSDPTGSLGHDPLSVALNDDNFDHRTNDLCIECEAREST
ncbi:hypothetical protein CPB86DRAFT_877373 [Serendipita vermifera]|nr:hypothetical protein CPB86DRAFT_877373 [Serendipita vermifera]